MYIGHWAINKKENKAKGIINSIQCDMKRLLLSVIIPFYNEESRIKKTLYELGKYLDSAYKGDYEILAIDDASTDRTLEMLETAGKKLKKLRVLRNQKNLGKGGAIKNGLGNCRGKIVVLVDADMPLELSNIKKFEGIVNEGYDMVIGSKYMAGSKIMRGEQQFLRWFFSRGFNLYVRLLFGLKFRDTQCGFKVMTQKLAKKMACEVKRNRFEFDVELLLRAEKSGARIKEAPIEWYCVEHSTFSLRKNMWQMFVSLLKLRLFG